MTRILILGNPHQSLFAAVVAAAMEEHAKTGVVMVETTLRDGEPQARIIAVDELYEGEVGQFKDITFHEDVDFNDPLIRVRPAAPPIFKGPSRQEAQWKLERKWRR